MLKPEGDQAEDGLGAGKRDRQTEQALEEGWSQAAGTGMVFLEREGLSCPGDTGVPGRGHVLATAGQVPPGAPTLDKVPPLVARRCGQLLPASDLERACTSPRCSRDLSHRQKHLLGARPQLVLVGRQQQRLGGDGGRGYRVRVSTSSGIK